jgi:hypothetical protein
MAVIKHNGAVQGGVEGYLRELARKFTGRPILKVGFLEGATYPDGKSVAMVASFNEFGTRNMPPRPFFRRMIADKSHEWGPAAANLLKSTNYDVDKTLMLVGEGIKGQLQQSINDLVSPPLAQSTIDRKGFSKPLIDTSVMINSVDYEVKR